MKKFSILATLAMVVVGFSTASAELIGVRDIIGDQYPDILFDNSGAISYTASNDQFILTADDLKIVYSDGSYDYLSGVGVTVGITVNLQIDDLGQLVGTGTMEEVITEGQVTVQGNVYGVGTTLLAGSVYSFGWGQAGSELGMFDFLIDNVTGSLVTDGIWPDNDLTGIFALAEGLAEWSGDWDADFDLDKVKGDKAPVPEPVTMVLMGMGGLILLRKRTIRK